MSSKVKSPENLPSKPGVYIMRDASDTIIYIGKAKKLKNRVTSYFRKNSSHTSKVLSMVSNIYDFDYFVTINGTLVIDKNDNIRSIEDIHSEIMDKVIEFLDKK